MAGAASVLENDTLISRLDRTLLPLERTLALVSGLAVFSLMLLAVVSVGGRQLFDRPLPGYVDWIEQAMPLIAFMGISFVQREGGHIRMDAVLSRFRGRALWAAEFVTVLAMLIIVLALTWGSFAHFERSFDWNAPLWSTDSSFDIYLPLWPAKLLAPIAFFVLTLRLILQLVVYGRAFWLDEATPAGAPLIADAATQAAREAESVSSAAEN